MKLLVTADLHLGRRPSYVPESEAEAWSCTSVWQAVVEAAIVREVDALLLVGDVVDESNRYFEALGPLEQGLARLAEAEIPLIAVAGNHDADVLPRLADSLDSPWFLLLGAGGTWESHVLVGRRGRDRVQIFGWSFPGKIVRSSPLRSFPRRTVEGSFPVLGLLHADVGVPESPSCPVRRSEFDRTEVPLWLLGHVHLPDPELLTGELPAVGYVGSPQGIDPGPGERGFHGPLLLDIGATRTRVQRMAVGGVRYEELEISLEGVADEGSLQQRLAADLSAAAARMKEEQPSLAVVSLRLTVSGRCALPTPDIDRQAAQLMETGMEASGVRLHVTRCTVRRLPMLDAEVLAQGRGLVAELARTALALESDDLPVGATAQLLAEVVDRLRDVDGSGAFAGLDHGSLDRPLDEPAIRALAARQAWRLLDALVCQGQTGGDA